MHNVGHRAPRRALLLALLIVAQAALVPSPASAEDLTTVTTISVSATSSYRDEDIVLRATVTPNPGGGYVSFYDTGSGTCLCSAWVSPATGEAVLTTKIHHVGTRQLQAVFGGHGGFGPSESELLAHERSLRPSSVLLEIGPINDVGEVALTTTVVPHNVGGTLSISAASGEPVVSDWIVDGKDGVQTLVRSAPLPGTGPYIASYSGTLFYASSVSDPVPWSDDRVSTSVTLEVTPEVGAPYDTWTLRAKVDPEDWGIAGPMDGVVRFYSAGQLAPFATVPVSGNGVAQHAGQVIFPGIGTYHAVYSGDEDYVTSTSAPVTVRAERIVVTTTLALSAGEVWAGEPVIATVTLDPAPTVFPPDPVVGLTLVSAAGDRHFEAIAIDSTGSGTATITADELVPEIWTATATFAQAPPDSQRYVPSSSEPVQLRYEPVGPRHALSIEPEHPYHGDPATLTLTLTPAPTDGVVELYATTGAVGETPLLLGSVPAAGTVTFDVHAVDARRYHTRFFGSSEHAPSRSAEFIPEVLGLPNSSLSSPSPWTSQTATTLSFAALFGTVTPTSFECSLDGGPWNACSSPHTTAALPDGSHAFRVRAIDGNGRVEPTPSEVAWRVDTTAPTITAAVVNGGMPTNQTTVSVALELTDQALGRHGGSWQRLLSTTPDLDSNGRLINPGGPLVIADPTAPFAWNLAPPGGSPPVEGVHTLYVQVADPFGHWSEVVAVNVRYDVTPPMPSTVINDGDAATVGDEVTVTTCCMGDDPSGISRLRISSSPRTSGGLLADAKGIPARSRVSWSLFDPRYGGPEAGPGFFGTVAVYVQWRDRAGNWSAVAHDTIHVQRTGLDADHPYADAVGHRFESAIAFVFRTGWVDGCGRLRYCPGGTVSRAQIAKFISTALQLPPTSRDYYADDDESRHERHINRLAAAGIATGCGGGRYCPGRPLSRAQAARFFARAVNPPPTTRDFFTDDAGSKFESQINRLAAAGRTVGCGAGRFCPDRLVTRAEMAAFLRRALE